MKFKLFLLASLLIFSCNSSDNVSISLYNFLPNESSVIININDLNNTKEILNKNKILPIVLSSTKEISTQLNLLSNKNSEKEGILSLSNYGKDQIAFTYIRKSNSLDSIQKVDKLRNKYQKSEIFFQEDNGNEIYKVIIGEYLVSSNKDLVLRNMLSMH